MIKFIKEMKLFIESLSKPTLRQFVTFIWMIIVICIIFGFLIVLISFSWMKLNTFILSLLQKVIVFF